MICGRVIWPLDNLWHNFKDPVDKFKMLTGSSRRYVIENLTPKTFYFIRAKAQNLAGYSDPSNTIYLQTSAPHSGDNAFALLLNEGSYL